jgi:uncharacterized membrane protein YdjX (TVP38/TMEM64 family)
MTSSPHDRRRLARLAALGAIFVALAVVGHFTPAREWLSPARLRPLIASLGLAGAALFVAIFAIGELLHVPGLVFVAVAVLAYGRLWGGLLAFAAAVGSVCVSFAVVRGVGGQALAGIERPLLRRLLDRLEAWPVRTVVVLRTVFVLSPPLNYALALSPIRFRDYLVGSAIGLVLPIGAAVVFFDWLVRWL